MIHGVDGSVRTLCLDLDTSKASHPVVLDDAAQLGMLLTCAGLSYVEDFSPSGGRHLYVPLREAITAAEARQLVEALTVRFASLDPSPHQNITDGCIRVPGSAHKRGGHQVLVTPLTEAYGILTRRNPVTAVAALRKALAPEVYRLEQARRRTLTRTDSGDTTGVPAALPSIRHDSPLRLVARTGLYDTTRYSSPSEARMAVLNHFAACRWSLEQVRTGMSEGQYQGLTALYGTKADRLLPIEWAKAQAFTTTDTARPITSTSAKTSSSRMRGSTAHNCHTSPTLLTGGSTKASNQQESTLGQDSVHQLVNDLENILYAHLDHMLMREGRVSISLRFLIRAVLAYMRTNQTNILDVGCRTFALALGKDHGTIARLLPRLERLSAGILTRIGRAHGRAADTYAIVLPERFELLARELTWRQGKIHAVRPVFRALGDVAALTYEGIERGRRSPTTADLTRITGISRRALIDHLARMEALGMIRRHHGRWEIVATTNLTQLADRLGATEDREEQITRYRIQRAAWHAWLDRHLTPQLEEHEVYDAEVDEYWLPPAGDEAEHQRSLWNAA
ncbi:hypothetical protein [Arthrobacter sp. RIT-PI-e]|uniref:hypothetical protein n=1 Tax=Arthrobacter sp. RIT-PI-e TaxID=1681197 RepID=UPI0006765CA8|nr:hypothetical protein [Arthrobacter sp. RIT-PI-e]